MIFLLGFLVVGGAARSPRSRPASLISAADSAWASVDGWPKRRVQRGKSGETRPPTSSIAKETDVVGTAPTFGMACPPRSQRKKK
ncbi:hypothetical protein B0T19DRAFT_85341 [Cercophora scortea]|uniref:Uncharacterized protein n=1 Tax=Cercophora scortea TaxID=314031 RepID=A0AAE0MHY3_9PEZI|nr:hypothetical protein B0T19DRAFT_85341 [Cercophora scortea]